LFSHFQNLSYVTLIKLFIEKVIFFSISRHKISNFKVRPPNEVEIWMILAWKVPVCRRTQAILCFKFAIHRMQFGLFVCQNCNHMDGKFNFKGCDQYAFWWEVWILLN
jgi:hypothetical protein